MTPEQKTAILGELTAAGMTTAGSRPCKDHLNSALVGGTVVKEGKTLIPKAEVLAMLDDSEIVGLLTFFASATDQAKAFEYRWNALENLDVSHPVTRASVQALSAIFAAEKISGLLAMGERDKTKADEILGRLATEEDIEEARS